MLSRTLTSLLFIVSVLAVHALPVPEPNTPAMGDRASTNCSSQQFEVVAPSGSAARACANQRVCNTTWQYVLTDATPTSDRVCAPYDTLPTWTQQVLELNVAVDFPVGGEAVLAAMSTVAVSSAPLTYRLQKCNGTGGPTDCFSTFTLDPRGSLFLTQNLASGGKGAVSFVLSIVANDNRTSCRESNAISYDGPCASSPLQVIIMVVAFANPSCPRDVAVFLTAPGANGVAVTWVPPGLHHVFRPVPTVVASHIPGQLFVTPSAVNVTYTVHDLAGAWPLRCVFVVRVVVGLSNTLLSVGHKFSAPTGKRNATMADYLVDSTLNPIVAARDGNGGLQLSPVVLDISQGVSFSLHAQGTTSLVFKFSRNMVGYLHVNLVYCSSGEFPALDSEEYRANFVPTPTLFSCSPHTFDSRKLGFVSGNGSSVAMDGRCFRLTGQTTVALQPVVEQFEAAVLIDELFFSLVVPADVLLPVGMQVYSPMQPSLVVLEVKSVVGDVLVADQGISTFVQDTEVPVLVCPEHMVFVAAQFETGANLSWIVPRPADNVGVSVFLLTVIDNLLGSTPVSTSTSSYFFAIKFSPYTLVYTVSDAVGLNASCEFSVTVNYEPNVIKIYAPAVTNTIFHGVVTEFFGTFVSTQYLVHPDDGIWRSISIDMTNVNMTAIDFILPVLDDDRMSLKNSELQVGVETRLVANLVFSLSGDNWSVDSAANSSLCSHAYATVYFDNSSDVEETGYFDERIFFLNDKRTCFDVENSLVVIKGSTPRTNLSLSFSAIRIRLNFPAGRGYYSGKNLTLRATSQSSVFAETVFTGGLYDEMPPSLTQVLYIRDIFPPTWTGCQTSVVVNTTLPAAIISWAEPVPRDNRAVLRVDQTAKPGAAFAVGMTRVVYTAVDPSGNSAECVINVTVRDVAPPIIDCPTTPIDLNTTVGLNTVVVPESALQPVRVTDNSGWFEVSGNISIVCSVGWSNHTLTAMDGSGNHASCSVQILVRDAESPQFLRCDAIDAAATDNGSWVWAPPGSRLGDTLDNVGVTRFGFWPAPGDSTTAFTTAPNFARDASTGLASIGALSMAFDAANNSGVCFYTLRFVMTAAPGASSGSSSMASAEAAGVASAVVAIVALVVTVALLYRRRGIWRRPQSFNAILAMMDDITSEGEAGMIEPREIARDSLRLVAVLGHGNFGFVSKGFLKEHRHLPAFLVAVKALSDDNMSHNDKQALLSEAALMAQFNHPHVVRLVGVVTVGEPLMVVLEYCEFGSLHAFLPEHTMTEAQRLVLAGDCAEALLYLTKRGCIHRDIAARNVLVSSEVRAKVSDFGMSRASLDSEYYISKGGAVPVRWTAPEALESKRFTPATDCWSFGVLLFEIWTNAALPYGEWGNSKVWLEVSNGYRLPCPGGCSLQVHAVMLQCWDTVPDKRPQFQRLAFFFRTRAAPPRSFSRASGHDSFASNAGSVFQSLGPASAEEINNAYVGLLGHNDQILRASADFFQATLPTAVTLTAVSEAQSLMSPCPEEPEDVVTSSGRSSLAKCGSPESLLASNCAGAKSHRGSFLGAPCDSAVAEGSLLRDAAAENSELGTLAADVLLTSSVDLVSVRHHAPHSGPVSQTYTYV